MNNKYMAHVHRPNKSFNLTDNILTNKIFLETSINRRREFNTYHPYKIIIRIWELNQIRKNVPLTRLCCLVRWRNRTLDSTQTREKQRLNHLVRLKTRNIGPCSTLATGYAQRNKDGGREGRAPRVEASSYCLHGHRMQQSDHVCWYFTVKRMLCLWSL